MPRHPNDPWQPPVAPPGYYNPGYQQGGMPFHHAGGPIGVPYEPEKLWANPTSSSPGPLALENRGFWATPKDAVQIVVAGGQEYDAIGSVETPIFDLRPDLRAASGVEPVAHPIFRGGAFGAGGRLHLQFYGLDAIPATVSLRVFYVTFADTLNPFAATPGGGDNQPLLYSTCKPQEITDQFYNGNESVVLSWSPDGGPVRFWRLTVFFWQYGMPLVPYQLFYSGTLH